MCAHTVFMKEHQRTTSMILIKYIYQIICDYMRLQWTEKWESYFIMEMEPSGETWPGKSTNNQDLVLSCSGRLDIQNLYGHRSVHQPEGERYTRHKLTRQMPTKTARHAAGEHQLRLLGFHQSLSEEEEKKKESSAFTQPPEMYL